MESAAASKAPFRAGEIRTNGLTKVYYEEAPPAVTTRQKCKRLATMLGAAFPWLPQWLGRRPAPVESGKQINGLQDLTIDIAAGSVLGIIGAKGSGKSTLLRLLGGLTAPTSGRARVAGRVAAVLEARLSAFHRSLTVAENLSLQATRLRLGRRWLRKHLASLLKEAGLSRMNPVPVSHVPRDAYVRLAWGFALRVNPDILLVSDEMTSGDADFDRKTQKHLTRLKERGKTILLETPDSLLLTGFCTHGLLLHAGELHHYGDPSDAFLAWNRLRREAKEKAKEARKERGAEGAEWHWVAGPTFATYMHLDAKEAKALLHQGLNLTPAEPPWALDDPSGNLQNMPPWQPAGAARPTDRLFDDDEDEDDI
jgi:ABC-type polysaccharide/polyol phosphate transport system ATPase subunit